MLLLVAFPVVANAFSSLQNAVRMANWSEAQQRANLIDADFGGDYLTRYVRAAQMVHARQCEQALPLLADLVDEQPGFVAVRELAFFCHSATGNSEAGRAELAAMLAILPEGPTRELVEETLARERAGSRPRIGGYLEVKPSSNVNRQTEETAIGNWTIAPESRGEAGMLAGAGLSVTQMLLTTADFRLAGTLKTDVLWSSADELLRPTFTLELPMSFGRHDTTGFLAVPFASAGFDGDQHNLTRAGMRGVISTSLTPEIALGLNGAAHASSYALEPWRDGWALDGAISLSGLVAADTRLTATLMTELALLEDPTRNRHELSGRLRLDHIMEAGLILALEGTVGQRWHARPAPLSNGPDQIDTFHAVRVELAHRDLVLPAGYGGAMRPTVYYEYRQQHSDNVFYRFGSHDVGIAIRMAW